MAVTKSEFSVYIKEFRFKELFNEMGWNNDRTKQAIQIEEDSFRLTGIGEKSGFRIFVCEPPSGNKIPGYAARKKIEGNVTKLFHEHLIIFIDEQKREQVWQLAVRKSGSPTKISETRYHISQDPELLYQRASGLFFTLDEEEKVTIVDVTKRVAENFQQNNELVTKKFYESFKKEHSAFLKFIKGIADQVHMDWYASLMLNRLMFCYFIQKKGFLDNNKNYLQVKLKACKEKKGKNKFYSFYRDFLLALFHKGLGAPERKNNLEVELGKIPYLNGGLFDEHEIEKTFKNIAIDDKAFENLFDFFDQYEWHLDTRETASGRDINPDVIGYIFEKYINDRAQMGAYYTKEDITDYIAKNCVVPWLFDEVKRQYPKAFAADGPLWRMARDSGDGYIYDAVKQGVPKNGGLFDDMPDEIKKGFDPELEKKIVDGNGPWLWELRKEWNKQAPSDIALPTEIYRELIERRKRYADVKSKIENGEIHEINDFITYNLNIRQFAQDAVETADDAEFIRHFYKALCGITVLDPTCGSGAFLFAAMNILEPLYEACIRRMENFIVESGKGRHKFFKEVLAQVNAPEHPNLQYFIYKSIILNNIYGVDIMNEAVEIAKLRLFLKLVATVDADYRKPNLGLEPLPDVDFNIRAGNTLVGYATEAQLHSAFQGTKTISGTLDFDDDEKKIKEKCDIVGRAFTRYKEIQLQGNEDFEDFKQAKNDLNERLDKLRKELDVLLHKQHYQNVKYATWHATHQPFHWFAEFYENIQGKGGFDVIIGNPPWVEYAKLKGNYYLFGYSTFECNNLWAFVVERSYVLVSSKCYIGLIVPMSLVCTDRMLTIQRLVQQSGVFWISNFESDSNPGQLFDSVKQNITILIGQRTSINPYHTTKLFRFYQEFRNFVFPVIEFVKWTASSPIHYGFPKVSSVLEIQILEKMLIKLPIKTVITKNNGKPILVHRIAHYYIKCFDFVPYFRSDRDGVKKSEDYKEYYFSDKEKSFVASINSSTFYFYWQVYFDAFKAGKLCVESFPLMPFEEETKKTLNVLAKSLMLNIKSKSLRLKAEYKATGKVEYDQFFPRYSKPIIDQIDCLLARHYGFTQEELDFIINYDIKYRMGKELDSGEDDEHE